MQVLLKRLHLNGHTIGFHPQSDSKVTKTLQVATRVKKFICDNEWFNTFSLWWKSLSTTISRFFAFKRPAYLKLNKNKSSLRFFFNFTVAEITRRFRKKSGHTQFYPALSAACGGSFTRENLPKSKPLYWLVSILLAVMLASFKHFDVTMDTSFINFIFPC